MSALLSTPFGAALVGASVAATVLLVPALFLVRGPLRRRPALRSWVATVTLVTLVAVPPTAWWAHAQGIGPHVRTVDVPVATVARAASVLPDTAGTEATRVGPSPAPPPGVRADAPGRSLGLREVWLLGVLLALLPVLVSYVRVRRLRRSAVRVDHPVWERVIGRVRTAQSEVRVSARLTSPVTIGLRRPQVILPVSMVERPPGPSDDAVLAHEFAHAARRDGLASLVERIGVALFWFHPAAWWLLHESCVAREEACDNHALLHASPGDLARSLVELSRRSTTQRHGALIAGVRGWSLEERVRGLMDDARDTRSTAATGHAVLVTLAGVALGIGAAACGTPHTDEDEGPSAGELEVLREIGLIDEALIDGADPAEVDMERASPVPLELVRLGALTVTRWEAEFTHDYGHRGVDYTLRDGRPFPMETTWEFAEQGPVLAALATCRTVAYRADSWPGAKVEFDLRGTLPNGDVLVIGFHAMPGGATISRQSPDGTLVGGHWSYRGGDAALARLLRNTVPAAVEIPQFTPVVGRVPAGHAPVAHTVELLASRAEAERVLHELEGDHAVPAGFDFAHGVAVLFRTPASEPSRTLHAGTPVLRHGRDLDLLVFDRDDASTTEPAGSVMVQFIPAPVGVHFEACRIHFQTGGTLTLFR